MQDLLKLKEHFSRVRYVTIACIVSMAIITVSVMYLSNESTKEFSKRIYIVDKNKQFEAIAGNIKENRPVEIAYHTRRFHELFFSISPDAKQIEDNMQKAFYLSDESSKRLFEDLKEQNYFDDIIRGNAIQKITIDSLNINSTVYPYEVTCFSTLEITRATAASKKKMVSSCVLEDMPRSVNSPNGLFIRRFKILSTEDEK